MTDSDTRITGGCQCGAVRYALHAEPEEAHICHCRMCQKAFASPFAAYFSVPRSKFELTRGKLSTFASSAKVERGFCAHCGTPLTAGYLPSEDIHIALVSLDDPARLSPSTQVGIEARLPWVNEIAGMPAQTTGQIFTGYEEILDEIAKTSRQHPDHDTDRWPPPQ
jgi:hypothetical protein